MYALLLTDKGKGYACFAVKKIEHNKFEVASSFCSPLDRAKFMKTTARDLAKKRLNDNKDIVTVNLVDDDCPSMTDIVEEVINSNDFIAPNWVYKAIVNNLVFYTLELDNNSVINLLLSKDEECEGLARDYIRAYYKAPKISDIKQSNKKEISDDRN